MTTDPTTTHGTPRSIDTSRPHPARRYDYWLGGKDNFAADRTSAQRIAAAFPTVRVAALENRRYLHRVVKYLATRAGIRQFLDIGTGFPTSPNVHKIAQAIDPTCRVVYVDNDPMVVAHARALMTGTMLGRTGYIEADLRTPDAILTDPVLQATLDLTQPVGLLLIAVLHFLDDSDDPYGAVRHLTQALAPGSHLALSHSTLDPLPADVAQQITELSAPHAGHGTFRPRTRHEVTRFVEGMTVVDPGVVPIVCWQPEQPPEPVATIQQTAVYGAAAQVR